MFTKQISGVEFHFGPLIIYIVVILAFMVISAISFSCRRKRVAKCFDSGDYDKVLIYGNKLLKKCQKYSKRYKHKTTMAWIEYLHVVLAISYFSVKNFDEFLIHINALSQYDNVKECWLSLYYLYKNDFDNAELHYNKISESDETRINRAYIEGFKQYKQGEYDLAKETIGSIYMDIKQPVLRHIADEILK